MINHFKDFNIVFDHIVRNVAIDALENATARMSQLKDGFSMEIIYKPFVQENVTKLHIFNEDQ